MTVPHSLAATLSGSRPPRAREHRSPLPQCLRPAPAVPLEAHQAKAIAGELPKNLSEKRAFALAVAYAYDKRGGTIEIENKQDKSGLGIQRRQKKRANAQHVLTTLNAMAHNANGVVPRLDGEDRAEAPADRLRAHAAKPAGHQRPDRPRPRRPHHEDRAQRGGAACERTGRRARGAAWTRRHPRERERAVTPSAHAESELNLQFISDAFVPIR